MIKEIDHWWFTNPRGSFGIVLMEEEATGKRKLYIAPVLGFDEKSDIECVKQWGAKLHIPTLIEILKKTLDIDIQELLNIKDPDNIIDEM